MRNKKAQGLSIRMIVIIALAVFVLFLIIGFVTGGWAYFAKILGLQTEISGEAIVANKCSISCSTYVSAGCPNSGAKYNEVYNSIDIKDVDNDGTADCYSCLGTATCSGTAYSNVADPAECSCS